MERLFPTMPGMPEYQKTLRWITKESNDLLLRVVEDLSYSFSDNREITWEPDVVDEYKDSFLAKLIDARDSFVYRNEAIILNSPELDGGLTTIEDSEGWQ